VATFRFSLVNHLGEEFGSSVADAPDDEKAKVIAQALADRYSYPIAIRSGRRLVAIMAPDLTEFRSWVAWLRRTFD